MTALRVLIAEGDADLRQDFHEYFDGLGCEAEVVGDCAGCLDRLRRFHPHVLLIDSDLPGGVERILSLVDRVGSIRRVIVMGGESSEQLAGLVQRTATCVFQKPFHLQALANVLAYVEPDRDMVSPHMYARLVRKDGSTLGLLRVETDDQHRRFSQHDVDLLANVASRTAEAFENVQQREQSTQRHDVEKQLESASQVQLGFLPHERPQIPNYEFFDCYHAALGVGGDFFDYVPLPGGRLAVTLGDVAGKGVAAALLMARLYSMARHRFLTEPTTAQVLSALNSGLTLDGSGHSFVTFIAVVLDPQRHEATIVNAGHMPPLLVKSDGQIELVGPNLSGLPLGIRHDEQYEQYTLFLEPGDTLVLYTDGITEAMNRNGEIYGTGRLREFLAQSRGALEQLGGGLVAGVQAFVDGGSQRDDLCLVCVRRN